MDIGWSKRQITIELKINTQNLDARFIQKRKRHNLEKKVFQFSNLISCFVDLRGIEPRPMQCECTIVPFNHRPEGTAKLCLQAQRISFTQIIFDMINI